MVKNYIPERGDIVLLDFDPQSGHEQSGRRPALVISPKIYNGKVGLAICCPVTGQVKGYPFEVALGARQKTKGVVLSDHVKNLDFRSRNVQFVERVGVAQLAEVLRKLGLLLG